MSPSPDDTPMTATAQQLLDAPPIDPDELRKVLDDLPDTDGGFKTGCFGPSPRDAWGSLEVAGLRAQIAQLTERADTQKSLIEDIVSTMQSMTKTMEGLADIAALHNHRLRKLDGLG